MDANRLEGSSHFKNKHSSFSQKVEPVRPLAECPEDIIGPQTYQETHYIIGKSTLYSILASLEFGLEIAQEALIEHDQYLGRAIMKNKMWAEELEREIEKFKKIIEEIKKHKI